MYTALTVMSHGNDLANCSCKSLELARCCWKLLRCGRIENSIRRAPGRGWMSRKRRSTMQGHLFWKCIGWSVERWCHCECWKLIRENKSRIDVLVYRVPLTITWLGILLIVRGSIGQTKGVAAEHDKTKLGAAAISNSSAALQSNQPIIVVIATPSSISSVGSPAGVQRIKRG